jgi:hypothetical protein
MTALVYDLCIITTLIVALVAGACECGEESSGSIKCREFLD